MRYNKYGWYWTNATSYTAGRVWSLRDYSMTTIYKMNVCCTLTPIHYVRCVRDGQ